MNIQHQATQSRYVGHVLPPGADIGAALALRAQVYRGGGGIKGDIDRFDPISHHILVTKQGCNKPLAYARLRRHESARSILQGYCGKRYALQGFAQHTRQGAEMGRLCLAPGASDVNVLRSLWGVLGRCVVDWRIGFVFGCHSFAGVEPLAHQTVFRKMTAGHRVPDQWEIRPKHEAFSLTEAGPATAATAPAHSAALTRSYMAMGARFSDQGAFDHDLNRLHVFACLELRAMPIVRRRGLLRLAREIDLADALSD